MSSWGVDRRHRRGPARGTVRTSDAHFERAADRLAALGDALEEAVTRARPDPADVARALDGAYRGIAQPRPDLAGLVLQWVGEAIGWILQRISRALGAASTPVAWLVVLLAVVAVAVLVWRRGRLVPDRVLSSDAGTRRGTGPVDWSRLADEAIRAGDLREAVRALYLALLASLAGRGLLADAPTLTAGEARSAVSRARPALFPAVARATESYERVMYGGAPPDQGDLDHLRQAAALARRS